MHLEIFKMTPQFPKGAINLFFFDMKKFYNLVFCLMLSLPAVNAQMATRSWADVVNNKNESWFDTDTAKAVAENVLLYQKDIGGWPKNIKMQLPLTDAEKAELLDDKFMSQVCTIDNGATFLEMKYLSRVYRHQPDVRYKEAFLKGVSYLLKAQYKNGGWPQFYPLHKGYSTHITYNDDAMVNVMKILHHLITDDGYFSISGDKKTKAECQKAFDIGIECILKTQYKQNGVLTGWCAQHDEKTLVPVGARSFELTSLSGLESAGVVLLLMSVDRPSPRVVQAVDAVCAWFEKNKINGLRVEPYRTPEGLKEKRLVEDKNAGPLWGRFMNLDDNRPFFSDRDGVKKYSLMDIGRERRAGYRWYSDRPQEVLKKYPVWRAKVKPQK